MCFIQFGRTLQWRRGNSFVCRRFPCTAQHMQLRVHWCYERCISKIVCERNNNNICHNMLFNSVLLYVCVVRLYVNIFRENHQRLRDLLFSQKKKKEKKIKEIRKNVKINRNISHITGSAESIIIRLRSIRGNYNLSKVEKGIFEKMRNTRTEEKYPDHLFFSTDSSFRRISKCIVDSIRRCVYIIWMYM